MLLRLPHRTANTKTDGLLPRSSAMHGSVTHGSLLGSPTMFHVLHSLCAFVYLPGGRLRTTEGSLPNTLTMCLTMSPSLFALVDLVEQHAEDGWRQHFLLVDGVKQLLMALGLILFEQVL